MAKIDKSLYTKSEWKILREQRRLQKEQHYKKNTEIVKPPIIQYTKVAFVLGNGVSRKPVDLEKLATKGTLYGCNAIYRTFSPNFLIAVDVKMVLEIAKHGYQNKSVVWTNPNKAFTKIKNLNFFNPSKGWSSGPTALWLAAQHGYSEIYILGFDYKGLFDGKKFNNIYADTPNYKKSTEPATFFGNWARQTKSVIKETQKTKFIRVVTDDFNYTPESLQDLNNYSTVDINEFLKWFNI